jgi:hypothetical protein
MSHPCRSRSAECEELQCSAYHSRYGHRRILNAGGWFRDARRQARPRFGALQIFRAAVVVCGIAQVLLTFRMLMVAASLVALIAENDKGTQRRPPGCAGFRARRLACSPSWSASARHVHRLTTGFRHSNRGLRAGLRSEPGTSTSRSMWWALCWRVSRSCSAASAATI